MALRHTVIAICLVSSVARADERPLAGYKIVGQLQDREDRLRKFLDVKMVIGQPWTAEKPAEIAVLLKTLHYHLHDLNTKDTPEGIRVTLSIHPFTLVRHVDVTGNWPIFEQYILRRMSLRPGVSLPEDDEDKGVARRRILNEEA